MTEFLEFNGWEGRQPQADLGNIFGTKYKSYVAGKLNFSYKNQAEFDQTNYRK